MFDIFSWQHIIIMLVVALVVVGPKDLPRLMNMAGKWAGKARAMANEFRKSFDEMARQAELDELRREIDELKKNNPISGLNEAMNEVQSEIDRPVELPAAAAAEFEVLSTAVLELEELSAKPGMAVASRSALASRGRASFMTCPSTWMVPMATLAELPATGKCGSANKPFTARG